MKINVEGYKSIAERRSITLSGLTILSGTNSSGKSSFMQPLLLIKQTLENNFDAGALLLEGPNVRLTDSSEIISKVPNKKSRNFSVGLQDDETEVLATYKFVRNKGVQIESVHLRNSEFEEGVTVTASNNPEVAKNFIPAKRRDGFEELLGQKVSWKTIRVKCFLMVKMYIHKRAMPFSAGLAPASWLEQIATGLIHVPGLRGNPERTYRVSSAGSVYPGSFDRYTASIIHKWKTNKSPNNNFQKLTKQLHDLGLASSIDTINVNETRLELLISRYKGCPDTKKDYVNIADVGFGVSQTLPVLVSLLAAKKDQVVYIEQPELHLHPRAQFILANIIAEAVVRGVYVVIETHSSILIRGIQILVAKKELDPKLVSLNWFTQNPESGQTEISEAKLDKYGAFGEWPEDFDSIALEVEQEYLDAVEMAEDLETSSNASEACSSDA